MDVVAFEDPIAFRERAADLLLADEARHNLMLGILWTLTERPGVYEEARLWTVEDRGRPVIAAIHNPAMEPRGEQAVAGRSHRGPGRRAAPAEDRTPRGDRGRPGRRRVRWSMVGKDGDDGSTVNGPAHLSPDDRPAGPIRFRLHAGRHRAGSEPPGGVGHRLHRRGVPRRCPGRSRSDGRPRASGGWSWTGAVGGRSAGLHGRVRRPDPQRARVGPVYTPPSLRRRGYATAVVAAVSRSLLDEGRRFCFLYTDLANPTSNRIYIDIGYGPVCDSRDYRFEPP